MTVVWDEFGGYDAFENGELLKGSLRSLLREASKHQYYPILIAHGDQSAFYPGVANILTTVRNSTVKVETIGAVADDFGTMRPTGKASITWLDGSVAEVTWPAWLTQDYLLGILQAPPAMAATMAPVGIATDGETSSHNGQELPQDEPGEMPDPIAAKVAEKLTARMDAAGGDWVNIRDLSTNLVSQPEEREIALNLIRQMINAYQLETMDKENPNKTISYFVRVKNGGSIVNKTDYREN
jgi:hypothetical protein